MSEDILFNAAAPGKAGRNTSAPKGGASVPINEEQIAKAKETIQENHPLTSTPLAEVFPLFKPVLGVCSRSQDREKQPLLDDENRMKKKLTSKKTFRLTEEQKEDTFNQLGFGMVAYKDLMVALIILFILLSIYSLPALYFFSQHHGIKNPTGYSQYSLGNLGYSSSQCQRSPFDLYKITMFCPFGSITQIKYLGINPDGVADRDACLPTTNNKVCSDHINPDFLTQLTTKAQASKQDDFSYTFIEKEIFRDPINVPNKCKNLMASLYIQYSCEQDQELMARKHKELSYISCLGVLIACSFTITIYFLKRNSKLVQIDWDIQTITPGDYTLQYEITNEAYNYFLQNVYYPSGEEAKGTPIGTFLKDFLKTEIERILTEKLSQLRRDAPEAITNIKIREVKIADIGLAFNNAELINLLRQRGAHIMYKRFDKMREVEKKISQLKDEKFMDLTKPVDAFITFEEEDGSIIGQYFEAQYSFSGNKLPAEQKFLGTDFYLSESTEPTNILWENRHWTPADYFKRGLIVFSIITLLILISFSIIFFCKSYSIQVFSKYPTVECPVLQKTYTSAAGKDLLAEYAQREYDAYYKVSAGLEPTPFSGALQCFCDGVKARGLSQTDFKSEKGDQICKQYSADFFLSFAAGSAVSYLLVAINYVLRLFIIKLIIYLGKDTESEQTRLITNGVFIVQFFNTALLLLMVNANLREQFGFLGGLFNGKLADFNSNWFADIGKTLIGAMVFNIYWPALEACGWYGFRLTFRMLDRKLKTCNDNVTGKTTVQQYVELYSGPVFFIHYKYSSILNITFVTMMYGMGIPLLFPIAASSIFMLYCVEKIMIYYSYRQPPMYDEKLNNNVLQLMTYAPLLYLSFGYWMLSSHQLNSNEVYYQEGSGYLAETGHVWYSVFQSAGYSQKHALPLIITFWISLFVVFFRGTIYKYLSFCFPSAIKVGELEIDEDLDNYFECVDEGDRHWSIAEEENARNNLGLKVLSDYTFQRYQDSFQGKKFIHGVHCYDILANPLYLDDFQYFSPSMDDREKYIIDDDEDEDNDNAQSDLVKVILNLAFLTQKQAREFSFSKDAYKNLVKEKKANAIN